MTHYQDIHLLADGEMSPHFLMSILFRKFHKRLAFKHFIEGGSDCFTRIGLSFPKYRIWDDRATLGRVFRIHGTEDQLAALDDQNWRGPGLASYTYMDQIRPVPEKIDGFRMVKRYRPNNFGQIRKRLIKRLCERHPHLSESETRRKVFRQIPDRLVYENPNLPFICIKSSKNDLDHRVYIKLGGLCERPSPNKTFTSYGLSKTDSEGAASVVPWF